MPVDLDLLPDGAVTFNEANWKRLNLTLQINDLRIADYHRYIFTNHVIKLTFLVTESMVRRELERTAPLYHFRNSIRGLIFCHYR